MNLKSGVFYESYVEKSKTKNTKEFQKLKKKLSKISIIVVRLDKNGQLKNSKPCHECVKTLKLYGFKNICYSTGDEQTPYILENIKTLENPHRSQMTRFLEKSKTREIQKMKNPLNNKQ